MSMEQACRMQQLTGVRRLSVKGVKGAEVKIQC